jgi:hypothetical protein
MHGVPQTVQQRMDRPAHLQRLQGGGEREVCLTAPIWDATGESDMSAIDKWIIDTRAVTGLQTEAVRRETENEAERVKRQKLDGPKEYEKKQQQQSAKSAKLRELRLAKEAEDAVARSKASASPAPRKPRAPRKSAPRAEA